ncbi:hypothetical protein SDC9_173898 [bioreactor metagenome]|uniref:Uncharacterized protein n=1 Tax=bioreactor metagenome TaxID=1076179 RepID=A0A645GS64_9ZZZZ
MSVMRSDRVWVASATRLKALAKTPMTTCPAASRLLVTMATSVARCMPLLRALLSAGRAAGMAEGDCCEGCMSAVKGRGILESCGILAGCCHGNPFSIAVAGAAARSRHAGALSGCADACRGLSGPAAGAGRAAG